MIHATIAGTLGADPDVKEKSTRLRIATSRYDSASKERVTDWITVWAFRCPPNLSKGSAVVVRGELVVGEYQGKPDLTLRADAVEYAPGGRRAEDSGYSGGKPGSYGKPADDGDIPF